MSKRAIECDIFEEPSTKLQELSTPETEIQAIDLFALPTELIYSIISYLSGKDDIMNLLLVSKHFRKLIFESSEIMRKFIFILDFQTYLIDFPCVRKFIINSGYGIRYLQVEVSAKKTEYLGEIIDLVNKMPNLEELELGLEKRIEPGTNEYRQREKELYRREYILNKLKKYNINDVPEIVDYTDLNGIADLSKLKFLHIRFQDLKKFSQKVIDLKSIKKLSITTRNFKNQSSMIDMFNNFENLEDLVITENGYDDKVLSDEKIAWILGLPEEDVKLKLKLKNFTLNYRSYCHEALAKFIENQVDNLQELELLFEPIPEVFSNMWLKFNKLKRLRISFNNLDIGYKLGLIDGHNHIQMETVKCFETSHFINLKKNYEKFPNLETFKSQEIEAFDETFYKLTTLELACLDLNNTKDAKFPNLKIFYVINCIENFTKTNWISFCKNIPNVENVIINNLEDTACNICVLDCLPIWKKLKTFQYRHDIDGFNVSHFDITEYGQKDFEFYKISIDTVSKIVKICNFIVENDLKILRKIYENFSKFEFFEFCFEDSSQNKLFAPPDAMTTRAKPERTSPHYKMFRGYGKICPNCYPDVPIRNPFSYYIDSDGVEIEIEVDD